MTWLSFSAVWVRGNNFTALLVVYEVWTIFMQKEHNSEHNNYYIPEKEWLIYLVQEEYLQMASLESETMYVQEENQILPSKFLTVADT